MKFGSPEEAHILKQEEFVSHFSSFRDPLAQHESIQHLAGDFYHKVSTKGLYRWIGLFKAKDMFHRDRLVMFLARSKAVDENTVSSRVSGESLTEIQKKLVLALRLRHQSFLDIYLYTDPKTIDENRFTEDSFVSIEARYSDESSAFNDAVDVNSPDPYFPEIDEILANLYPNNSSYAPKLLFSTTFPEPINIEE
jgi:hypothetical protein